MRVVIYGFALAGATGNIAIVVERIVTVFPTTGLVALRVAPTRTADSAAGLTLIARFWGGALAPG